MKRWTILVSVVAFALSVGWAGLARADIAYAYAQETISSLSVTPATGTLTTVGAINTGTNDAATVGALGAVHSDPTDAPQAYVGTPPPPPENYFVKYAAFPVASPLPLGTLPNGVTTGPGPLASFARGDVQLFPTPPGTTPLNSGSVVSEGYLNTFTTGAGSSVFSITRSFMPSATTAVSISYNFANDIYLVVTGAGTSQASYKFDVTVKDAAGNTIFDQATSNTNISLASPPNGGEIIKSGSETLTTPTLTGGATYTIIFSGSSSTFVSTPNPMVPEPSSMALVANAGVVTIALLGMLRRRWRRQASL
jgi:hypothetical protein